MRTHYRTRVLNTRGIYCRPSTPDLLDYNRIPNVRDYRYPSNQIRNPSCIFNGWDCITLFTLYAMKRLALHSRPSRLDRCAATHRNPVSSYPDFAPDTKLRCYLLFFFLHERSLLSPFPRPTGYICGGSIDVIVNDKWYIFVFLMFL